MDVPECCISFSPNWFYPQIVVMNEQLLAYGANDQVFVHDWRSKQYMYVLQAQSKVTCLLLHDGLTLIGSEGGVILIFEGSSFKGKVECNIITPMFLRFDKEYILFDERGVGVTFSLDRFKISHFRVLLMNQPHCIPKYVNDIVVYSSGRIYSGGTALDYPQKILYVDEIMKTYAILSKKSKILRLHVFTQLEGVTKGLNLEIQFVTNDKLPTDDTRKAPISIKFVTQNLILITSRQGEFFILKLDAIKDKVILDSNNLLETQFIKVPIELHLKGVFLLGRYQNTFFSVGQDRRIVLTEITDNGLVSMYWKMVLLSSRVQHCQLYENLLFFQDQTLRALDLTKKHDPVYVNEFWKCHSFDNFSLSQTEGVVAINKPKMIEIYDIYAESSLAKIPIEEAICKVIWMKKDHFDKAMELLPQQEATLICTPTKIKQYLYVVCVTAKIYIINLQSGQLVMNGFIGDLYDINTKINEPSLKTFKLSTLQSIHTQEYQFIICYAPNNILSITKDSYKVNQVHTAISAVSHTVYNQKPFILVGSPDSSIAVFNSQLQIHGYLRHKFQIEQIKTRGSLVLAIARAHSSLQIWDLSTMQAKANIRGHSGFITNAEFYSDTRVISMADDQTIKVFDLQKIVNTNPPNKKKNKTQKKVKI